MGGMGGMPGMGGMGMPPGMGMQISNNFNQHNFSLNYHGKTQKIF